MERETLSYRVGDLCSKGEVSRDMICLQHIFVYHKIGTCDLTLKRGGPLNINYTRTYTHSWLTAKFQLREGEGERTGRNEVYVS